MNRDAGVVFNYEGLAPIAELWCTEHKLLLTQMLRKFLAYTYLTMGIRDHRHALAGGQLEVKETQSERKEVKDRDRVAH